MKISTAGRLACVDLPAFPLQLLLRRHPDWAGGFEILGVIEPGFTGVDVGSDKDLYVPVCAEKIISGESSSLDQRASVWLRVIGRPKPESED